MALISYLSILQRMLLSVYILTIEICGVMTNRVNLFSERIWSYKVQCTYILSKTFIFAKIMVLIWCDFDRASSLICGKKCQLHATEVFIADLIACSTCFGHHYGHHQELKSIIQWLLPVVFRAVVFKLLVWCGAEGYVSGLQDAAASCKPDT